MIQLQGIGLQCGHSVPVQITRANPGSGHVWTVSPQATPVLCTKIRTEVQWSAERTTILHYAGASLRTPEHLAAALLGWPHCDLNIHAPENEIPIMDGSAKPFVQRLEQGLGPPIQNLLFYECPLQMRLNFEYGFCECAPSEGGLQLDVSLNQHGYTAQTSAHIQTFTDLRPLLDARTFIFMEDYQRARQKGWLQGADEQCGILLCASKDSLKIPVGAPLRQPQEPLFHKMLDLIGDLALLGPQIPRLKIRIHNGGHAVHHDFMERIRTLCP